MATELWFRDPWNYIREMSSTGYAKVVWNWSILNAKRINPVASAELYFGSLPWEALCIGGQGASHYKSGDKLGFPTAVYPVFHMSQHISVLEHYLNYPSGENAVLCDDVAIPKRIRPVLGQEHRVVISGIPPLNTSAGEAAMKTINELQQLFPEAVIHASGVDSYKELFGKFIKSGDFNPRPTAQAKIMYLPSGLRASPDWVRENAPHYFEMFDLKPSDVVTQKQICVYNVRSAVWSSTHYADEVRYMVRHGLRDKVRIMREQIEIQDGTPVEDIPIPETKSYLTRPLTARRGDKFACNLCSLQLSCKLFRVGAVCAVPGAEPVGLAKFFQTRDSGSIIDGLSVLVQAQMSRVEDALLKEGDANKGLDPEVSKELTRAFQNGTKLAQLVDPNLRPGSKVQVNVNGVNTTAVGQANPQEIVSQIIRSFEQAGIPRAEITRDMVSNALAAMAAGRPIQTAIESA